MGTKTASALDKKKFSRKCAIDVTLGRVRITIVAVAMQYLLPILCVCVCVCVCVCNLSYPACIAHAPYDIVIIS
jgi:hypothetical protein